MAVGQTSVSSPHDLLELPELGKEPRQLVVDLGSGFGHYLMLDSAASFEPTSTHISDGSSSRYTTANWPKQLAYCMSLLAARIPTPVA